MHSNDFLKGHQSNLMGKGKVCSINYAGTTGYPYGKIKKLDLSHTIHKNQLKMDHRPN